MKAVIGLWVCVLVLLDERISALVERKYVDLSYSYDEFTITGWGEKRPFKLVITNNGTLDEFDGVWMQAETMDSGTHTGTHMDAPCHVAKGRWTLDQIPLDRLFAPAAVVDIGKRMEGMQEPGDALLLVEDLRKWEWMTRRSLDHSIVLVRTGWGSRWPDREAYTGNDHNDVDNLRFPGVSEEAARWLVRNRKIYGLGIESLSLDSGRNIGRRILPAHQILLDANIYGLENVANLEGLPISGAMLSVLPMKIRNACGGPVRIVARLPPLHV